MRFLAWIWPRRWWQWSLLALAAVLLTFVALLPRFLREAIEAQLAQATTAIVRVAEVDIDFFRQSLTVRNVILTLVGENRPVVSIDKVRGEVRLLTLLQGSPKIENISLSGVRIGVVQESDGGINLGKLLPSSRSESSLEPDLPTLTVEQLRLSEVEIEYRDLTSARQERPVQFSLYELTTGPIQLQAKGLAVPVPIQLRGSVNLGGVAGEGTLFWSRSETIIDATINLQRVSLALVEPYLYGTITVQELSGEADARFHYQLRSGGGESPIHKMDGALSFVDASFIDPLSGRKALQVEDGRIIVEHIDLLQRDIRIASVELRDLQVFALQTPKGLNWTSLAPPYEAPVVNKEDPGVNLAWRLAIQSLKTQGGEIVYHDDSWPEAEMVKIVPTQLEVREIRSDVQEAPIRFQLAVGVGQVAGEGTLSFAPVGVKAQASLSELWLTPLRPLLARAASVDQLDAVLNGNLLVELTVEEDRPHLRLGGTFGAAALFVDGLPAPDSTVAWTRAQLEVSEGSVIFPALDLKVRGQISDITLSNLPQGNVSVESMEGDLRLTQRNPDNSSAIQEVAGAPAPAPEMSVHGRIGVNGFVVRQGPHNTEVLSWHQAQAELQEGSHLVPLDLRFAEVALEYPYVQGFRTKGGVLQLAKPSPAGGEIQSTPLNVEDATPTPIEQEIHPDIPAPVVSPLVQITHASLIGGQLYFEDQAVTPSQTIYWQDIRVDLNGVGYPFARPTAFTLHAFNMDGAPIEVSGSTKRQGQQLVTQVEGTIDRLAISRFNVYLAPQLGYRVRQGSVSVKWKLMMPGDILRADAAVTLHDFGLGGKESASGLEEQVGLPMHLIVALLKDLNGDINLQLPVEGRLNEPGFRLGGTVWRAIRDVLVGAVTSPLKLLGALFRQENSLKDFVLNPIEFEPGTSRPDTAGIEQLARLKLFLSQRPEVDLRLNGSTGDEDVLMRQDQLILARLQSETQGSAPPETAVTEQGKTTEDVLSEEVRTFLAHRVKPTTNVGPPPLSDQAAALLARLRKETSVAPQELQQLAQERVETVITALTEGAAVSTKRLHVSPKRVRGQSEPAVQYVIQAGEEN